MMRTAGVDDLDFLIWRIVLAPEMNETLESVKNMTLKEIAHAHFSLDVAAYLQPEPDPPKPGNPFKGKR